MFKSINRLCIAVALASTSACGDSSPEDVQSLALDALNDNGIQLNGFSLNGFSLNGFSLNGFSLNGFSLNGFSLNGFSLNGVSLSNNSLSAQRSDNGATISGKDFIGVHATVSIGNGDKAELRVDDAIYNSTAGIYVYNVSIQTDAGWTPICGTANGVPVSVVPSPGSWDMTTGAHNYNNSFTLGCVNAAIGKCVVWGYHPWDNKTECSGSSCRTQSLTSWQDACTRMVRADYCGDGVPHTRNGTTINVWDTLGIQLEADSSWDLEAEWATDGAHCIKHTRWARADLTSSYLTDLSYVLQKCPSRLASSNKESCGDDSDFNTKKGLNVSPKQRRLLRNESALNL